MDDIGNGFMNRRVSNYVTALWYIRSFLQNRIILIPVRPEESDYDVLYHHVSEGTPFSVLNVVSFHSTTTNVNL